MAVARGLAALAAFVTTVLPAQEQRQDPGEAVLRAEKAIDAWLATHDEIDEEQQKRTLGAVLDAGEPALRLLGKRWRDAAQEKGERAVAISRKLDGLGTHVVIGFVQKQADSGVIYAGQYGPLRHLQPQAGRLLLKLLFDPPQWFPDTHRSLLVPALRDVYPDSPGEANIDQVVEMVEDEEFESLDLRRLLSYALYQWGHPEHIEPELRKWRRLIEEGEGEDELLGRRELAQLYYNLRDYRRSAQVRRDLLEFAARGGFRITPIDYYNAACTYNLSGDPESALTALEKCAELQASDEVDPSLKLERKLFEGDPEIALLRGTERFRALMEKAFGPDKNKDRRR